MCFSSELTRQNLLEKTGVAVPLMPMLPSRVQNTMPLTLIEPRRPLMSPPNWASAIGIAIIATAREMKRMDLIAMVGM